MGTCLVDFSFQRLDIARHTNGQMVYKVSRTCLHAAFAALTSNHKNNRREKGRITVKAAVTATAKKQ